jgi:hypothetical protein
MEPGITCGSALKGDENDAEVVLGLDLTTFFCRGRPMPASLFRVLLGVAMTWTPCPRGFRTGFFGFLELELVSRFSTSWAISLATSSRFGFLRVRMAASSSFF